MSRRGCRPGRPGSCSIRRGSTTRRHCGSWGAGCWRSSTPPPPTPRKPAGWPRKKSTRGRWRRSPCPMTVKGPATAGSPSPPCTGRCSARTSSPAPPPLAGTPTTARPSTIGGRFSRHQLGLAFMDYIETRPAESTPSAGGVAATVVVTMELETLLGGLKAASLDTGGRISAGQARRLACQAGIIPVVLGGGVGRPRRRPQTPVPHRNPTHRHGSARPGVHRLRV